MPNPIVHFEILAGSSQDKAALQDFYRKAFGWEIQSVGAPGAEGYGLIAAPDGRGIGGAVDQAPHGPAVLIYIEVDDPHAYLEKVKAAGGEVLQDVETIPGMVTFATFRDPAGNIVGIVDDDVPPPA